MRLPEYMYTLSATRPEMPGNPTSEEGRLVGDHFEYLKDAIRRGQAVFVGRTQDDYPRGFVVFEAETPDAAREFMMSDPALAGGIITAELFPFRTALMRGRDET